MTAATGATGRTISVLMGDIASSTANWLASADRMIRALEVHDDLVSHAVSAVGGEVFKHTGDGFIAWFEDPGDAVAAALRIRAQLARVPSELEPLLQVRLAVDTGWATSRSGDWFGPVVNRVARLTDLSSTVGVIASRVAIETAREPIPATPLGSIALKSHREPLPVFGVDGATLAGKTIIGSTVPTAATSFIGRESEQRHVRELLSEARIVTLVATGGAGKTRLATAVASELAATTGFVDLVPCRSEIDVARRMAVGIGVEESALSSEADPATVIDHLAELVGETGLVLVVDNCEHVIDAVRTLVPQLLAACSNVRILATSREALDLAEERVFSLPMLEVGVELFLARAAGHGIDLEESREVREAIAEICTRLDGLPLAIEVAAARLRDTGLREIMADLELVVLAPEGTPVAGSDRRTMRDVVGWSHGSLPHSAQALFERLSLFEGAFGPDALSLFASAQPTDLRLLVRRSLLLQERRGLDLHYRLLEPVRQVARSLLAERGAEAAAHQELIDGFLTRFESEYGESWWSWDHLEPAAEVLPTAWALIDWLIAQGDDLGVVRLLSTFAGAATVFSGAHRVAQVLSERTDVIASLPQMEQAETLALYALSGVGSMQIEHSVAGVVALFELGLPPSPPQSFAVRMAGLGAMNNAFRAGEDSQFSLDMLEQARRIAAQTDSHYEQAAVEAFFGWCHLLAGDWPAAEAACHTGINSVEPSNIWHVVLSTNLGFALIRQGRHEQALAVTQAHPDLGRYYYMSDMLGLVEVLALAGTGDIGAAYAAFGNLVDRVLASNHPGHRSDLALIWAWLCVFDGRADDALWVGEGVLTPRGPHTMQLTLELPVRVRLTDEVTSDTATAEAWLPVRLAAARDLARERANAAVID